MEPEVILLAAGSGTRMGGQVADKILVPMAGGTPFRRCVAAFLAAGISPRFIVAFRDSAQRQALSEDLDMAGAKAAFVPGGRERQDSVRAGLALTRPGSQLVFIHDCARALVHPESIRLVAAAARADGAAVLARPVTDTIKRLPDPTRLRHAPLEDLDRRLLWSMETPQVFRRDWIHAAYENLVDAVTDDTAAAIQAGHGVTIVPNPHPNPKLTRAEDLRYFRILLEEASRAPSP